jgi:hypothetical protein
MCDVPTMVRAAPWATVFLEIGEYKMIFLVLYEFCKVVETSNK